MRKELERCSDDELKVKTMCENVHGIGECNRINKFTYNKMCPINFVYEDHTRCKRDCKLEKTIIDFNCWKRKVNYVNSFETFSNISDCEKQYKYCKKRRAVNGKENDLYYKTCSPDSIKIGFMCVPVCLSEMTAKMLQTLKEDINYCVQDYVNIGMPFYDFQ